MGRPFSVVRLSKKLVTRFRERGLCRSLWILVFNALAAVVASPATQNPSQPIYKFGFGSFPPYQVIRADGRPDGFAVQVVEEAAKRAGLKFEWAQMAEKPVDALAQNEIDIYPLLAVLPERKKIVSFSKPWWENTMVMMSLAGSEIGTPKQATGKRISVVHSSFGLQRLQKLYSQSIAVPKADYREVVSELCGGRTDAALMETRLASALQFLDECKGKNLRMRWVPELNLTYGIGARKGLEAVADILYEKIIEQAQDGTMTKLGEPWGVAVTNQRLLSAQLLQSQLQARTYSVLAWFGAASALLLGILVFQLRKAKRHATEALAAKSRFMASVSHEIRTPLHGLLGMASELSETAMDAAQREQVSSMQSCGDLLLHQLNDILDFAKLEATQLRIERIPFSLRELLIEVERVFRPLAASRGIQLVMQREFDLNSKDCLQPHDLGTQFLGDPNRLKQILYNLLSNAVRFTERGRIELSVCMMSDRQRWRFLVRDTGIGIPLEAQARLFQPFAQADDSISRRFGGTGLGLAICNELTKLMEGEMGFHSQSGKGSEFWFEVPLTKVEVCLLAAKPDRLQTPLLGMRVLVAEDNLVNQRLLTAQLKKLGCSLALASTGRSAVEAAKSTEFDLILMDCEMPEMDGFEAARQIRALSQSSSQLPIIAVTASTLSEDLKRATAAGMNDLLTKPYSRHELQQKMERWAVRS
jgi:signal transduction histidine kinase